MHQRSTVSDYDDKTTTTTSHRSIQQRYRLFTQPSVDSTTSPAVLIGSSAGISRTRQWRAATESDEYSDTPPPRVEIGSHRGPVFASPSVYPSVVGIPTYTAIVNFHPCADDWRQSCSITRSSPARSHAPCTTSLMPVYDSPNNEGLRAVKRYPWRPGSSRQSLSTSFRPSWPR